MSGKFIRRTLRNILWNDRPYYAHLALARRGTPHGEFNTNCIKRLIDGLDRLGVAVITFTNGSEPELRDDFEEIVSYAGEKGFYLRVTLNGSIASHNYRRLLSSRINEISIAVDAVEGEGLPFRDTSHKVLQMIYYLHGNLPEGKHLTLNVTATSSHGEAVPTIADYCAREFPGARVSLDPECLELSVVPRAISRRLAGSPSLDVQSNGQGWICKNTRSLPIMRRWRLV